VDDTGFAINASALDDIVIEFVGFLLGDEGRHIRVIQVYRNIASVSTGKWTLTDQNVLYGVIQKRMAGSVLSVNVQNNLRFHDWPPSAAYE
jgi:hypothetical protein